MKKLILLSIILLQLLPAKQKKERIKLTSFSIGNLTFARLNEHQFRWDPDNQNNLFNIDYFTDVETIHTKYISVGMRVLGKINVNYYYNTTNVPYLYKGNSDGGGSDGHYFYTKGSFTKKGHGISFQKELFNNLDILIGLYQNFTSVGEIYTISYFHGYNEIDESDINFVRKNVPFWGITYNIPIYKDFYIPIGIKGVIPFAFTNSYQRGETFHPNFHSQNNFDLPSPIELSIGIGHKSGFGF